MKALPTIAAAAALFAPVTIQAQAAEDAQAPSSEQLRAFSADLHRAEMELYAKYEVVNLRVMRCEGSNFEEPRFDLILKDGSVFSYHPYLECD